MTQPVGKTFCRSKNLNILFVGGQYLFLTIFMFFWVDIAIYYIQIFLFKKLIFKRYYLKAIYLILFFLQLFYVFLKHRKFNRLNNFKIDLPWFFLILFLCHVVFSLFLYQNFTKIDPLNSFGSLNSLYFFYFNIILMPFIPFSLNLKKVKSAFYILSFALVLFGIIQFIFNFSFVPLEFDKNGMGYSIHVPYIGGHIRAFSLFSSAAVFGYWLCLLSSISLSYFLINKRKIDCFFYVYSFMGVLVTLNRTNLILFFMVSLSVFVYYLYLSSREIFFKNLFKNIYFVLPYLYLLFMFFLFFVVSNLFSDGGTSSVLSSNSIYERFKYWGELVNNVGGHNVSDILIGAGILQNSNFSELIVDNSYLIIMGNVGVVGLFLWINFIFIINYKFSKKLISIKSVPLGLEKNYLPTFVGLLGFLMMLFSDCLVRSSSISRISFAIILLVWIFPKLNEEMKL